MLGSVVRLGTHVGYTPVRTSAHTRTRLLPHQEPDEEQVPELPPPQYAALRPTPDDMSLLPPPCGPHPDPSPAIMQNMHGLPHPEIPELW